MINKVINLREPDKRGYVPTLTTYIIDDTVYPASPRKRPAIIVLPGSAYVKWCPREGEPVALRLNAAGYHSFVLNYSCAPHVFPEALTELSDSVRLLRENADEWGIDPEKIAVCGFSAGGHIAACLGTLWNKEPSIKCDDKRNKPNALILGYPVISTKREYENELSFNYLLAENKDNEEARSYLSLENQVSADTPPSFIFHTFEDKDVPVENSLMFATALRKNNIPFELHIFPHGPHGLATATLESYHTDEFSEVSQWVGLAAKWLDYIFDYNSFMKK